MPGYRRMTQAEVDWEQDRTDVRNGGIVRNQHNKVLTELIAAARDLFTVVGEALIDGDSDNHEIACDTEMACERMRTALRPFDDVEV